MFANGPSPESAEVERIAELARHRFDGLRCAQNANLPWTTTVVPQTFCSPLGRVAPKRLGLWDGRQGWTDDPNSGRREGNAACSSDVVSAAYGDRRRRL